MSRTTILGEGYLSEHLTRSEVRAKSTGLLRDIDARLPQLFELVRQYSGGLPIKINSAIRNFVPDGGVKRSEHMLGNAFDLGMLANQIKILRQNSKEFIEAVAYVMDGNTFGIGIYPWGVHIDTDGQNKANKYWASPDGGNEYLMRHWSDGVPLLFVSRGNLETTAPDGSLIVDVDTNADDEKSADDTAFPWWIVLFFLTGIYFATKK